MSANGVSMTSSLIISNCRLHPHHETQNINDATTPLRQYGYDRSGLAFCGRISNHLRMSATLASIVLPLSERVSEALD
jgi:hypothetical protein